MTNLLSHDWPDLPLKAWQPTKTTLHLYLQILGKIRMTLHPKVNHWWHVTFYLTPTGLSTGLIPEPNQHFELHLNFVDHQLELHTEKGKAKSFPLHNGLAIADFYHKTLGLLKDSGVKVSILAKPFDPERVQSDIPFAQDLEHHHYDASAVTQYYQMLQAMYPVFQKFRGQFTGKSTPVHIFWHSMDLALTRFSGKEAPEMPEMDPVSQEAYSHEVISFGFWPGDASIPEPAFYSYTHPAPKNLAKESLRPSQAEWTETGASPMALLRYKDVRESPNPEETLREFLESTYRAGVNCAGWDQKAFRLP